MGKKTHELYCYFLPEEESNQRSLVEIETLHSSEFTPLFHAISVPCAKAVSTEIAILFLWPSHTAIDFDIAHVSAVRNPKTEVPKPLAVCGGRTIRFAISSASTTLEDVVDFHRRNRMKPRTDSTQPQGCGFGKAFFRPFLWPAKKWTTKTDHATMKRSCSCV